MQIAQSDSLNDNTFIIIIVSVGVVQGMLS